MNPLNLLNDYFDEEISRRRELFWFWTVAIVNHRHLNFKVTFIVKHLHMFWHQFSLIFFFIEPRQWEKFTQNPLETAKCVFWEENLSHLKFFDLLKVYNYEAIRLKPNLVNVILMRKSRASEIFWLWTVKVPFKVTFWHLYSLIKFFVGKFLASEKYFGF